MREICKAFEHIKGIEGAKVEYIHIKEAAPPPRVSESAGGEGRPSGSSEQKSDTLHIGLKLNDTLEVLTPAHVPKLQIESCFIRAMT